MSDASIWAAALIAVGTLIANTILQIYTIKQGRTAVGKAEIAAEKAVVAVSVAKDTAAKIEEVHHATNGKMTEAHAKLDAANEKIQASLEQNRQLQAALMKALEGQK